MHALSHDQAERLADTYTMMHALPGLLPNFSTVI